MKSLRPSGVADRTGARAAAPGRTVCGFARSSYHLMGRDCGFADGIDDCMDAGGRATPGAVAEARAARHGWCDCGFTMVELVITILIVGVLAVAVVPPFSAATSSKRAGITITSCLPCATPPAIITQLNFQQRPGFAVRQPCHGALFERLKKPTGETPYVVNAPSGVTLSLSPSLTSANNTMFFDARDDRISGLIWSGLTPARPSNFNTLTITITRSEDARTIMVEKESGYAP